MTRGRDPLHPAVRARSNKTSTAAVLVDGPGRHEIEVPELPAGRMWQPRAVDWWRACWQSPMRAEWDESDDLALLILCYLVDELLIELGRSDAGDPVDAKRAQQLHKQWMDGCRPLGLTPMARRSLQWQITQVATGVANAEIASQRAAAGRKPAVEAPKKRGRRRYKALE